MSRNDEGTRSRRCGHRDRLPGSPVGAWSEWRVGGHRAERGRAAQRRRSRGCGEGRAGGASERKTAARLEPEDPAYWGYLAELLTAAGRGDEALEARRQAEIFAAQERGAELPGRTMSHGMR